jgi:hypothetical protein
MRDRGLRYWLPSYLREAPARRRRRPRGGLVHILYVVCDHYEPRHGARREGQARERIETWAREYPRFRDRCQQAFGHAPRHTWFYPPHHGLEHLEALGRWAFEGHGEVELHLHHGDDDSSSLRRKLTEALAAYHRRGLLLAAGEPPRPSFGFIHGDWALDNSGQRRHCGVNDELRMLQEVGCWGDFTMPSANECQTRKINAVYYAVDDPERPKSHDRGEDAQVGRPDPPGLFLMQGPLGLNFHAPGLPRVENATLTTENWGRPDRIRAWLDCHVHVRGRPEWVFVKLHAHGGPEKDHDALFGERAFALHRALNERYNDGTRYRLHYLTAREAYNVAKAAEAGREGDPAAFRDFVLGPPAAVSYWLSADHRLRACTPQRLEIDEIAAEGPLSLLTRMGGLQAVEGRFRALWLEAATGALRLDLPEASTEVHITLAAGQVVRLQGAGSLDVRLAALTERVGAPSL